MNNREKLNIYKERKRREKNLIYKSDFSKFSKDNIKILTKDSAIGFVSFEFNAAQTIIDEALQKQIKETGKVRAVILKARQQGISTYCASRVFWKTYYHPHTKSVVMAHDVPTSEALFTMSRNIIDEMDDTMRPTFSKSNAREIRFDHNQSGYRLFTAGSPEAGRGTTPTIAHLSEVAFWQHDDKILAGLFQGISQAAGTEVILESTANGASGEFFRLWRGAVSGENEYIPIFIPWFSTPEYRKEAPEDFLRTAAEEALVEKHEVDDDQLYWRRYKIAESSSRKFQQEYPATPEEAFLVSGSHVFDPAVVHDMKPVPYLCRKTWDPESSFFDEDREGDLEIWKYPTWDDKYVLSADVAMGANQDYSVGIVMDDQQRICAMYRSNRIDPGTFGDLLFYLGRYYNNALCAVESNSIGNTTLDRLMRMSYVNLYYETKVANMTTESTEKLGFRTTATSKPRVIGYLKRAIEDLDIEIPSPVIIQELMDFVSSDTGKIGALPGCHDDTIIAMAIGLEVLRTHRDRLTSDTVSWSDRTGYIQQDNTRWF